MDRSLRRFHRTVDWDSFLVSRNHQKWTAATRPLETDFTFYILAGGHPHGMDIRQSH